MDTYSEEWRRACEIRWVLSRDREARADYYRLVAKHRGEVAAKALIAAVNAEYARSQQQGSTQSLF